MKIFHYIYTVCFSIMLLGSCVDNDSCGIDPDSEPLAVESLEAGIGTIQANDAGIRAESDYAVNQSLDPTFGIAPKEDWTLRLQIYKGNTVYGPGNGVFLWDNSAKLWLPQSNVYFPNYLTQNISATLIPELTWTGTIETDQSTDALLLRQDLLEQNGDNYITHKPAHKLTIPMRHSHTMLDFILGEVTEADIVDVQVFVGATEYKPYRVNNAPKMEYMVIFPVGTANPEITVTTRLGARYTQRINIDQMQKNWCYCVTLKGLELELSTITVENWTYGTAIDGNYSTQISYPTFQGPAGTEATLTYDNGITQTLRFNARGEDTQKPFGRTVIGIRTIGGYLEIDPPLILRSMIIDLNEYIDQI